MKTMCRYPMILNDIITNVTIHLTHQNFGRSTISHEELRQYLGIKVKVSLSCFLGFQTYHANSERLIRKNWSCVLSRASANWVNEFEKRAKRRTSVIASLQNLSHNCEISLLVQPQMIRKLILIPICRSLWIVNLDCLS